MHYGYGRISVQNGQEVGAHPPPLVKAHFDNFYNMYDKETNPGGLINMGTAESHLVNREVCDLLRKAADRMDLTGYNIHYNKFEGSDEFRSAIAAHWQKVIFGENSDVVLTKDNVATCAGCTVALETLATLLAEPGDVFLIPAPYYSSFVDDINERAGVIAVGVPCDEKLDRSAFEAAMTRSPRRAGGSARCCSPPPTTPSASSTRRRLSAISSTSPWPTIWRLSPMRSTPRRCSIPRRTMSAP